MGKKRFCMACRVPLLMRHKIKFCSNKCQQDYQHTTWVRFWINGEMEGSRGLAVKNLSKHLRKYLVEKYGNKCCICGWSKQHPVTGIIPLEVDHIDGNAENNLESNLQLVCPNCHALTPFYKNLNKGRGRKWRMDKYIKNIASNNLKGQVVP